MEGNSSMPITEQQISIGCQSEVTSDGGVKNGYKRCTQSWPVYNDPLSLVPSHNGLNRSYTSPAILETINSIDSNSDDDESASWAIQSYRNASNSSSLEKCSIASPPFDWRVASDDPFQFEFFDDWRKSPTAPHDNQSTCSSSRSWSPTDDWVVAIPANDPFQFDIFDDLKSLAVTDVQPKCRDDSRSTTLSNCHSPLTVVLDVATPANCPDKKTLFDDRKEERQPSQSESLQFDFFYYWMNATAEPQSIIDDNHTTTSSSRNSLPMADWHVPSNASDPFASAFFNDWRAEPLSSQHDNQSTSSSSRHSSDMVEWDEVPTQANGPFQSISYAELLHEKQLTPPSSRSSSPTVDWVEALSASQPYQIDFFDDWMSLHVTEPEDRRSPTSSSIHLLPTVNWDEAKAASNPFQCDFNDFDFDDLNTTTYEPIESSVSTESPSTDPIGRPE